MAAEVRPEGATAAVSTAGSPSRILVPLDLSEESEVALAPAEMLALRLGCPITLFGWDWDVGEAVIVRRHLTTLACDLTPAALVDVARTDDRSAGRPLLEAARREPGTLICMASHARTGVGAAIWGSLAEEVIRDGDDPVLLVGPHVQPALARLTGPVVACSDGSPESREVVPVAAAWAASLNVALEVVSLLEPIGGPAWGRWDEDAAADDTDPFAQEAGHVPWEVLQGGDAASAIVEYAGGRASLLALATHGRRGLARIVLGSVAIGVVRRAPCPVLLVRAASLPRSR